MVQHEQYANTVASMFAGSSWQTAIELSTVGFSAVDVERVIDAIIEKCRERGIGLKGIVVDAGLITLPSSADFQNAFFKNGALIVVDININDRIVVRRS